MKNVNTPQSSAGGTAPAFGLATGSPFFVVRLRGGTVLKLEARRAPDAQFDRLFALLDECEVWQSPTDWDAAPSMPGKWISGKRAMAGACTSESTLMPEYTANTADEQRRGKDSNHE